MSNEVNLGHFDEYLRSLNDEELAYLGYWMGETDENGNLLPQPPTPDSAKD